MEKNRLYRAISLSDLPKVAAGSLKAYRHDAVGIYYPATLIGTKFSGGGFGGYRAGWVVDHAGEQFLVFGCGTIEVDVTPEKRYAVWNHTMQRFQMTNEGLGFTSKAEAEAWIETKGYGNKKMYVVEWEIKNND